MSSSTEEHELFNYESTATRLRVEHVTRLDRSLRFLLRSLCSNFFFCTKMNSKERKTQCYYHRILWIIRCEHKRQARDELVVMTRDATEDEMSLLNMFFTWKRTFLAYDDITVLSSLRFSFSKDWVVNNFMWRQKCVASARCLRDVVVQRVVETVVKWFKYCDV